MTSTSTTVAPGKRRRGNPNWTNGLHGFERPEPSAFEKLLVKLGMNLAQPCEELAANEEVTKFARKHVGHHFVPEALLKLLGLEEWNEF